MDTHTVAAPTINFDNSFARAMDGFYVPCEAAGVSAPQLLLFNHDLAQELGLDATVLASDAGTAIFSGQSVPEGAAPLAQVASLASCLTFVLTCALLTPEGSFRIHQNT